mgnify:CR=1 FL=1
MRAEALIFASKCPNPILVTWPRCDTSLIKCKLDGCMRSKGVSGVLWKGSEKGALRSHASAL